jgi:enoyl-[acyl-carrier-protein] reductase (NADH)
MGAWVMSCGTWYKWMQASAKETGVSQEEAEREFLRKMRPTTLINRFTTTEEVANMVVYICSEQAAGTTGSALLVDGGVVRAVVQAMEKTVFEAIN